MSSTLVSLSIPQRLLTIGDVATILRMSAWSVRAEVRAGRLKPLRFRQRPMIFHPEEVVRYIDDSRDEDDLEVA